MEITIIISKTLSVTDTFLCVAKESIAHSPAITINSTFSPTCTIYAFILLGFVVIFTI
jgi:hypothetical protein